jgi:hypothetical protein
LKHGGAPVEFSKHTNGNGWTPPSNGIAPRIEHVEPAKIPVSNLKENRRAGSNGRKVQFKIGSNGGKP